MRTVLHSVLTQGIAAVFFFAASAAPLCAQVIELSGGTSTLFQSQGGTVTVHARGYAASAGAGTIGGKFYSGGQLVKSFEQRTLILGTDNVPFDLPTDIFETGHYITVVGLGMHSRYGNANVYGFLGETSTSFNSPFFLGTHAEKPAVMIFASGKVAPQWTAATKVLVPLSTRATIIHSFGYDSDHGTKFAVAGGMGTGQLYLASSVSIARPKFDMKAAYIESSSQFRRANIAVPLTAEPDRDNTLLTVRPTKWSSFSVGRQNYLTPVYQSNLTIRSSVNQASANLQIAGTSLSASIFQSAYGGGHNLATAYTATRSIGPRVHTQASYLISKPDSSQKSESLITTVQETLTPRWSVSQMVNTSGGRSTFGFGGSFLSNLATFSADYQTFYVPSRIDKPFEEALILNAQVHLFGRLTLNGGTFVAPDGSLLYTTEAEGTISPEIAGNSTVAPRHIMGQMVLRGRVVDSTGQPIMGAALLIDQLTVYTDSQGYFYVRERKPHQHPLAVLVDQFLDGGLYRVVSAPTEAKSSPDDRAATLVVVQRVTSARS
ncbi:MAG: hypothetical protein JSS95_12115 [Acidobacteria bacterium]|nr:hypothetical protein [Acidobacteriota bacterium]